MITSTKMALLLSAVSALLGVQAGGQFLNPLPAQALGTLSRPRSPNDMLGPTSLTPNIIEGREFFSPQSAAVDTSATPPILYVADRGNNRVLAFRDPGSRQTLQDADLVIGQRDKSSSLSNTPGNSAPSYPSGLSSPTSVAVDRQGNLFVLDFDNNRILRYSKPFEQQGLITADLVIGQPNLTSRNPNQSTVANALPSAGTLRFQTAIAGNEYAALAFDPDGNLWVTDNGNHRILRYRAAEVSGSGNVNGANRLINADYVLGQKLFTTATANRGLANVTTAAQLQDNLLNKELIRFGSALAFDAGGNLYFSDDLGRVLYWTRGFTPDALGRAATRILGIYQPKAGEPVLEVNDFGLTTRVSGTTYVYGPKGLLVIDERLYVSDTLNNRIVKFPPPREWASESQTQISPRISGVIGQSDLFSGKANRGGVDTNAESLNGPSGLAFVPNGDGGGDLYVVDSSNYRVVIMPFDRASGTAAPARAVLGQIGFEYRGANFIEGREFAGGSLSYTTGTTTSTLPIGPHAVIDYSSTPPRLYIADTGNNRILGYADARRVTTGARADIVIGQVDFYRNLINSPNNDSGRPSDTGLLLPSSVAVDRDGHLYVADTGNGRVLRFPRPFDQPEGVRRPDLVIGQADFNSRNFDVSDRTLARPVSIAFTGNESLVVADAAHHRVLVFARGNFANGMAASRVLGQMDFVSGSPGESESRFAYPTQISIDADDNLYVADFGNNRVQIYYRVSSFDDGNGVDASNSLRLQTGTVVGVTASKARAQFWVVDGGTRTAFGRVLRVADRDTFFLTGTANVDFSMQSNAPRAVILDERENMIVLDGANRATFHYPQLTVVNWANGFPRVAPSMIGLLRVPGVDLRGSGSESTTAPLPFELDGLELTVDGTKAPLMKVTSEDARFIVPKSTPGAGAAEFVFRRIESGEIISHSYVNMTAVSPAALMENPGITQGSAMAYNPDGSRNTDVNLAASNGEITVLMTGHGFFDGLPDDGTTWEMDVPTAGSLRAFLRLTNTTVAEAQVVSSTLDPERPGVWRLKVKLPQVALNGAYGFTVLYKNVASDNLPGTTMQVRPLVYVAK